MYPPVVRARADAEEIALMLADLSGFGDSFRDARTLETDYGGRGGRDAGHPR